MGTQLPSPRRSQSPHLSAHVYCGQNGCMDQDATCYGGRLRPRPHCVRCGPSSMHPQGHSPQISAHVSLSLVAKRLDGSRCHLVRRQASVQAAFVTCGPSSLLPRVPQTPILGPYLLWINGRPSQLLLSTCYLCQGGYVIVVVCLFIGNFAQKLPNGFASNFQGRLARGQ